jgi:uncharacterized protein YbcC (UPF0753/DUF2309 family)
VLLQPQLRVEDRLAECGHERTSAAELDRRRSIVSIRRIWKVFQSSAGSAFSFVESLGLSYAFKLFGAMLAPRLQAAPKQPLPQAAEETQLVPLGWTLAARLDAARGILTNLGLRSGFARLVVLCGHGSQTTNNPLHAGLDCGACGGHAGDINARVVAALLNDRAVRSGLKDHGIEIPDDTWFVAAIHRTTTDLISVLDRSQIPDSHSADLRDFERSCELAGVQSRAERAFRLDESNGARLGQRAVDWSEVRPEWGLAGNAAFIAAPRSRTRGVDLAGRCFLHSYEPSSDPEGKVLELIMTAPLVVASWINLQYYASTVDNRHFGCGNKVLHNVVGQFGLLEGNGGDLRTGLPQQSLHDGRQLQHEPLRLNVLLDAPRSRIDQIVERHVMVRHLIDHGWLHIYHLADEQWQPYRGASV